MKERTKHKIIYDPSVVIIKADEFRTMLRSFFDAGFKMAITAFEINSKKSAESKEQPYQFRQFND